jgi:hypothetical protein
MNQPWIKAEDKALKGVSEINCNVVTKEETQQLVTGTQTWKTRSIIHIQNYRYGYFKPVNAETAKQVNRQINNLQTPQNLSSEEEYLIRKGSDTRNPSKYRPLLLTGEFT